MNKSAIALLAAACAGALAGSDEDYLAGFVPYAPTPQTSNLGRRQLKLRDENEIRISCRAA